MGRYRLVSVKMSRREQKRDKSGNLMWKDDDKKAPVYETKQYGIGNEVELSPAEAKRLKNDVQPVMGPYEQSAPAPIKFEPDDGDEDIDPKIAGVLAGNVDQVLAYINDHSDDDETLEAMRTAEKSGKNRKTVLDAIDDNLS